MRARARAIGLLGLWGAGLAVAQPGVTYQGVLENAGAPADGVYDIAIEAYDARTGGVQLDAQTFEDHPVADGRFAVELDYLADIAGSRQNIWLEIHVRPGASVDPFTVLSPRQLVTAAPEAGYARRAGTVNAVSSAQIVDGPGVASFLANDAGDGDLSSSYDVLAEQTINCPADGHVLAIGLVTIESLTFPNGSSQSQVALSLDGATPYAGRSWALSASSALGNTAVGSTAPGVAMHMIPVSAGPVTVSLLARSSGSDDFADSPSLVLLYVPLAYGPVEVEDEALSRTPPRAVPTPALDRSGQGEIASLRARVDRLEALILEQERQIEALRADP